MLLEKPICHIAILLATIFFAFAGCGPSITRVPEDRPNFELDTSRPFHIEFGRGSGWHGLDTVKINEVGKVDAFRQTTTGWEATSFTLTRSELNSVLEMLKKFRVLELMREYHLEDVYDGTQWVFWVKQEGNAKTIYFNNHFPDAIVRFASNLDSVLRLQSRKTIWTAVPAPQVRDHEKRLWNSIKTQ